MREGLIIFLFFIAPFLIAGCFIHPMADDYIVTGTVNAYGFLKAQTLYFHLWLGRYVSTAMLCSINPLLFRSLLFYRLIPALLTLALFLGLSDLIRTVFGAYRPSLYSPVLGIVILAVFFLKMPSTAEGLFWMTGVYTYTWCLPVSMYFVSCIVRLLYFGPAAGRVREKILLTLKGSLAAILIPGFNEISLLTVLLLLILIITYRLITGKPLEKMVFILLAVLAGASFFEIAAPGNANRFMLVINPPQVHNGFFAVKQSFYYGIGYLLSWLSLLVPASLILGSVAYKAIRAENNYLRMPMFNVHPLIAFCICALLVFTGLFPGFWAQASILPQRALNIVFFQTILAWAYFTLTCLNYMVSRRDLPDRILSSGGYVFCAAVTLLLLIRPNNLRTVYADLFSGRMLNYDHEQLARYRTIGQCGMPVCEVDTLMYKPASLFVFDFSADPENMHNFAFASFFKKRGIAVRHGIQPVSNHKIDQLKWKILSDYPTKKYKAGFK